MTLCAAWIKDASAMLACDSRLSFTAGTVPVDAFVKLTAIRCAIYPPRGVNDPVGSPEHEIVIGCLFAGSAINAYAIKEHLSMLLQRVQYVPGYSVPSAVSVFKLAEDVFSKVAVQFRGSLHESAKVQVLLVAHCPVEKSIRSILMKWADTHEPVFEADPLAKKPDGFFFGSKVAVDTANTAPPAVPIKTLLDIIASGVDPTVGGHAQLGELQPGALQMLAIDTSAYQGHQFQISFPWGGIDLQEFTLNETHVLVPSFTAIPLP